LLFSGRFAYFFHFMEFHQLRYFIAAADDVSMSHAAERLHVSQPALSKQIALLEAEIGVELFSRVKQRIHLTEAGRFFLGKARQIVCDAETMLQQTQEAYGHGPRTLRLGLISPLLDDLVAPAVREFRQLHPQSSISLFELCPRSQLDRLRNGELDAAILGNIESEDRHHFDTRELARISFSAVLPADHPLAPRESLKLSALSKEKWISLSDSIFPGRRKFLRHHCQQAGFEPNIVHEADSLSLMLASIGLGEGVGIVPSHSEKLPHTGCVFIPLTGDPVTSQLLFITRKDRLPSELQTLLNVIAEKAPLLFASTSPRPLPS
jgi:DNA-binding transcriptional LysR family regulator